MGLDIPTDMWVMCINPIDLNETSITQSQLSRKQDTPRDSSNLPQIRCWKCFEIRSVATRSAKKFLQYNAKCTCQIRTTGSLFFCLPSINLFHASQFTWLFSGNDNRKTNMAPLKNRNWLWQTWRRIETSHYRSQIWIKLVAQHCVSWNPTQAQTRTFMSMTTFGSLFKTFPILVFAAKHDVKKPGGVGKQWNLQTIWPCLDTGTMLDQASISLARQNLYNWARLHSLQHLVA